MKTITLRGLNGLQVTAIVDKISAMWPFAIERYAPQSVTYFTVLCVGSQQVHVKDTPEEIVRAMRNAI